ncbi:MAG: hypothetical protein RLZZ297_842 [Chloroflexota bacterium]|jgi:cell division protein FtsL
MRMSVLQESLRQSRRYIASRNGMIIALALLLAVMGIATVAQTVRVAEIGHEIDILNTEHLRLTRQRKALQLRMADAQSMERIERYAEQTGMIPVQDTQVRFMVLGVDDGQVVVTKVLEQSP